MRVYCDLTREARCVGILPDPGTELILTGTEVHTEPEHYRNLPLARALAEQCDVHFFFGADCPQPPFYTVPRSTVFARDSRGGYFIAPEEAALDWSEPIFYIEGSRAFRLIPAGATLADMGRTWRETMLPGTDFEVFPDRAAAKKAYDIRTFQQLMEEKP